MSNVWVCVNGCVWSVVGVAVEAYAELYPNAIYFYAELVPSDG